MSFLLQRLKTFAPACSSMSCWYKSFENCTLAVGDTLLEISVDYVCSISCCTCGSSGVTSQSELGCNFVRARSVSCSFAIFG